MSMLFVVVHNHYEKLDHVKLKCLCYYKYTRKDKSLGSSHKWWTLSNLFSDLLAHMMFHIKKTRIHVLNLIILAFNVILLPHLCE
jgi:hypothetical protein